MLPYEKERSILIKRSGKTNPKYGLPPDSRTVANLIEYGIINIDKQTGPTSHQVSAYVQQILHIKKAGHSGTLDPNVSGVLPIALGRGTRIVQALLNQGKEYICVMHLHRPVEEGIIRRKAEEYTGKITQLPPIKSAVKRQYRERTIYYVDIIEIKGQDILFRIGCQAGTYIRKYCHDFGKLLGTHAHMAELRRTKAAGFTEENVVTLLDVQDAFWFWKNEHNDTYIRHVIQPLERAVAHIPKIWILDSAIESVCHGSNVNAPGVQALSDDIEKDTMIAIMSMKDELIALGVAVMNSKELKNADRGIAAKTQKVFMTAGTYPNMNHG